MGFLAVGLAISPLAACDAAPPAGTGASESPAAPRPVASDDAPLRIELVRSGGLAGRTETVTVAPDGSWTYRSGSTKKQGRLSGGQASRLWRLSNDPKLTAEAKRAGSPPSCADGVEYALALGEDRRLQAVDCGELPPALKSVVTLLTEATPL